MATLTKAEERIPGSYGLFMVERNDLYGCPMQKSLDLLQAFHSCSPDTDNLKLNKGGG